MLISYVEIRISKAGKDSDRPSHDTTTLFVGANNSGKTSAMDGLCAFPTETFHFITNDCTLSNLAQINAIGDNRCFQPESFQKEKFNWCPVAPTIYKSKINKELYE